MPGKLGPRVGLLEKIKIVAAFAALTLPIADGCDCGGLLDGDIEGVREGLIKLLACRA